MAYFTEFWNTFLVFLDHQPPGWIYFFLFVGAFMENLFPPIPGDTLIVFGAYLAGRGVISIWPAYLAMWAGSALGCLAVYGLAFWKGRAFFLRLNIRFLSKENMDYTERWFSRYGNKIIVFNRFLPTARAFVGLMAGIGQMHPVRMVMYVMLGTFLWNSLLVYLGLMVGKNWQMVIDMMKTYNQVVLGMMVVGGIGLWFWHRKKKVKIKGLADEEDMDIKLDRQA